MAARKYIGLPHRPQAKLLPVRYPVYHAIAELNRSLEGVIESLEYLTTFGFFRREYLRAYQAMVEEMRALVNEELLDLIHPRELQNTVYYERIRLKWESQFRESPQISRSGKTPKAQKAVRR